MKFLQASIGRHDRYNFVIFRSSDNFDRGTSLRYPNNWIPYDDLMRPGYTDKNIISKFRLELIT